MPLVLLRWRHHDFIHKFDKNKNKKKISKILNLLCTYMYHSFRSDVRTDYHLHSENTELDIGCFSMS